jgi:hypothetical protein
MKYIFEKCKLECDKAKHTISLLHTLFSCEREKEGKFCACSRFMDKNCGRRKKSKHFLSIHYIAQNAK